MRRRMPRTVASTEVTPIPNPSPIKGEGRYLSTRSTHAGTTSLAGP